MTGTGTNPPRVPRARTLDLSQHRDLRANATLRGGRYGTPHSRRRDELACSDFLDWFDDADRLAGLHRAARSTAPADDIAFAGSASQALAVLLNGIDWQDGDRDRRAGRRIPE